MHQLTWSAARPHKLLIELDQQLLLILTEPQGVAVSPTELRITGCAQVTFDYQGYGDLQPHVRAEGSGTVRFVIPSVRVAS
jgi:hypothetical protein